MQIGLPTDQDFKTAISKEMDAAVDLLVALVKEPSTVGSEGPSQEIIAAELTDLGFSVKRLEISDHIGEDPVSGIPQLPYTGRYDVYGETDRDGGPTLLINGHIDVVPANPETWNSDPFDPVIKDGLLYGRGSADMKGGFAMAFLALRVLKKLAPDTIQRNLGILSVIEEECTGNGTLAAVRAGITADAVILPEPTELQILLGGVAVTWIEITIHLGGGHAESSDRIKSPPELLVRLIQALGELETRLNISPQAPYNTIKQPYNVNIGKIRSGEWASSVASSIELEVRIGHPGHITSDTIFLQVQALLNQIQKETDQRFEPLVRQSGFRSEEHHLDADHALVQSISQVHNSLHGEELAKVVIGSTTDSRYYLNQLDVPAISFGPISNNMHGSDESVSLDSIKKGAETLAKFIASYSLGGGLGGFQEGRW